MGSKLKGLQEWCRINCENYKGVSITNMTTSWRDGLAFCALIHRFHPELINFDSLSKENIYENNKLAFETASKLGISPFLDPEDMVNMAIPDKLSIITYVSQYYNVFRKESKNNVFLKRNAEDDKNSIIEDSKKKYLEPSPIFMNNVASEATCFLCNQKVYLLERFMDENKLYHRDCYRKQQRINFQDKENGEAFKKEKLTENSDVSDLEMDISKSNFKNYIDSENANNLQFKKTDSTIKELEVNQATKSDLEHFKTILKEKSIKGNAPLPPVKNILISNKLTLSNDYNTNSQLNKSKIDNQNHISFKENENKQVKNASSNIQRSISMFIKNDSLSENNLDILSTNKSQFNIDTDYNNGQIIMPNKENCAIEVQYNENQSINNNKADVITENLGLISNEGEKIEINISDKVPEKPKRPFRASKEPLSPKNSTVNEITIEKPIMRNPNPIPKPRRTTMLITRKELELINEENNKIEKTSPVVINKPSPLPRKINNDLHIDLSDRQLNIKDKNIPRRPPPLNVVIHTPTESNQKSLFQQVSQNSHKELPSPKKSISKATPPPRPNAPPNLNGRKKIIPNIKFNFIDDMNFDLNQNFENLTDEMALKKKMADQMLIIDSRLQQLEVEGKSLEVKIRECDITKEDIYLGQWFDLISKRNDLLREEADLIYSYKQHELEMLQANIESKLRNILSLNDLEKSQKDKQDEQILLNRLVDAVAKRNNIIDKMEEDRLRYLKEDKEIEKRKRNTINSTGLFQF